MSVLQAASPRFRLAVVGVAAAGVLATLGYTGMQDNLVYYRTPSEIQAEQQAAPGETRRLRLGGLVSEVEQGRGEDLLRFVVTDGAYDVPVVYQGTVPGIFRAGQGAVVEGTLDESGVFRADNVLVKHSNEYVDGSGRDYEPPTGN